MASDIVPRDGLTSRQIKHMTLSTDAPDSLTHPPAPFPPSLSPAERAVERFSLKGRPAILTGGAGHLALSSARALLEHGCPGLALWDLHFPHGSLPSHLNPVAQLIADFPSSRIITKTLDVTNAEEVEAAVRQSEAELGDVKVLVCFAGVVASEHAMDMPPEMFRRTMEINTTGAWLCAQAVGRRIRDQGTGNGSITLIASLSAHRTNFPQPQVGYNASKAALLSIKSSLAAEWARYGIRVNSISPGYMDTILNEGAGLESGRRIWKERNPMGRMGQPEEVAGVVVMLASRAGSYVNGADVVVDGGGLVF